MQPWGGLPAFLPFSLPLHRLPVPLLSPSPSPSLGGPSWLTSRTGQSRPQDAQGWGGAGGQLWEHPHRGIFGVGGPSLEVAGPLTSGGGWSCSV